MDLGRFDISKGPSNRGGLDLGLFEESNRPSNEVEFSSKSPIHRLKTLIFAHSLRSWRAFRWYRPSIGVPETLADDS